MKSVCFILAIVVAVQTADCQTISAAETVKKYSNAQKRLLVISTFHLADLITQHNLDQDSIMTMAGNITGMPFLLPYNETFPGAQITAISNLVNAGRINDAKHTAYQATTDIRIQGLLEIALWYLHQNGTHRKDLDSASRFIQLASTKSLATYNNTWQSECLLLSAELQYQKGNIKQSMLLFSRLASSAIPAGKSEVTARAYMRMADLLLPTDTAKETLYYKSLDIYRSLGLKEKQVELLGKIEQCHEHTNFSMARNDLLKIIGVFDNIGFKHKLFAQNRLAYVLMNTGDYLGAIDYARAGLENMKWSGLPDIQGAFFYRIGQAYASLGKNDEFVQWLNKALLKATNKSHLFWYKSLLTLTPFLSFEMNRPALALSIIDSVTSIFPPITVWEKMQCLSSIGTCYELLKKPNFADVYFKQLLEIATANPLADPYGEMTGDYLMISEFYVSRHNLIMAQLFRAQSMLKKRTSPGSLSYLYSAYYKIDSMKGDYKSALQNHIKYKRYYDSATSMDQRKKMDELTIKYAGEKKDQDIKFLKQQGIVQQAQLKQNKLSQNIMIAGTVLLLIIVGLLFNQYRLKQHSNGAIQKKNLALQHLVLEKEWLLKEVHHRVKNNLHTVISLLESQAAYLKNDALKAIENSQHRIYAMSLIHQKLYQAEDVKTIDMAVYLPEFIRYLDESFDTHYRIQFKLNIEPISLGASQAIPVALIINEAVTNSIKYAFPQNSKGTVEVTMQKNGEHITLLIADNGIGINESLINLPSKSLGLKLIKGLCADINASITFSSNNGTRMVIVFKIDSFNINTKAAGLKQKDMYA